MCISISLVLSAGAHAEQVIDYLLIEKVADTDTNSDCTQRGGLRVVLRNTHPSDIIDVQLDRYFSGVRQAGRSMFALRNGHSQPLGCDIVMGSDQSWHLIDARVINEQEALSRYGSIL
ncbi:MAG TPA: hypothetical protein ENI26_01210 [Methylophaga aminisulfidivorans]|uniref:Uncharacterized protein n=1 Tax=Methylophaga aminisulfidivorans TaxID=230105 RepID=A0A7C1ZU43_9GAMM|nr:hypothetical protein [Methylophaga aminisulfidivorans]